MRDDNNDAAPLPKRLDALCQCRLALCIKVRIRFIEHDKERRTVHGSGECHALPLTCGENSLRGADFGFIALGQPEDQLVNAGKFCGCDDLSTTGIGIKASNVFGDGAIEQGNVLRQISKMGAQCVHIPMLDVRVVQTNSTA